VGKRKPFTQSELRTVCMMTGFIVVYWAMVERQMDNCIHLIFEDLDGKSLDSVKPLQLKRKIKFLKKAFRKVEGLKEFSSDALKFLAKSQTLGNIRHDFVHGCISKVDGTIITLNRLDVAETPYTAKHIKFDAATYPVLVADLQHQASGWTSLAERLLNSFRPQSAQTPKPRQRAHRNDRTRQ